MLFISTFTVLFPLVFSPLSMAFPQRLAEDAIQLPTPLPAPGMLRDDAIQLPTQLPRAIPQRLSEDAIQLPTQLPRAIPQRLGEDAIQLPTQLPRAIPQRLGEDAIQLPTQLFPSTCAPTLVTTTRISTILITDVATVAHSCYTATITASPTGCAFNGGACVDAQCAEATTTTLPCNDACCPVTPTVTSTKACPTACDVGCATVTETATASCY